MRKYCDMAMNKIIGTSVFRTEGPEKVSGQTVYTADVVLEGMLWAKILRSPLPHARIRNIDISRARELPGVRAIITGQDTRGLLFGKQIRDMPVLCSDVVRFVGDRVAAVAADTPEAADEALGLIDVGYEELPAVYDAMAAMQPDAPKIHEDVAGYPGAPEDKLALDVHNGLTRLSFGKGDVGQGFKAADRILEHTFFIPARHQGYLEPRATVIAIDANGRIQVWATVKNPFISRTQFATTMGISEDNIRFNVVNLGGEFGGKGDAMDLPLAYLLAQRSGRPVKLLNTYAEELSASNPAHPTVMTLRSGLGKDGSIVARSIRCVHASGAYGALKPSSSLATWHYAGIPYRIENASFEFLQVYTNTVPGGYYRSPGAVAVAFGVESHTDLIAQELAMDPAEYRLKNLIGEGETDAIGHRLHDVRFREVLEEALVAADWKKPKARHRGRGIAISGRHISGGDASVVLKMEPDGTFTIISPVIDQGSGTHTILRQLVAEEMKVALDRVRVVVGDTDMTPRDSGVRASRVTYVSGLVMLKACAELRGRLLEEAARMLECEVAEVVISGDQLWLQQDPSQQVSLARVATHATEPMVASVYEDYRYPDDVSYVCAQVAEVEVDPETGAVQVHRIVSSHDVGTVINPLAHQGQIDGGAVMGFGQAIMEELVIANGRVTNSNLGDYKLPTIADAPELTTVLVESPGGVGPLNSKPIGEFANNGVAAAVANAVADAVGARVFEMPFTAEKIHRALTEPEKGDNRVS